MLAHEEGCLPLGGKCNFQPSGVLGYPSSDFSPQSCFLWEKSKRNRNTRKRDHAVFPSPRMTSCSHEFFAFLAFTDSQSAMTLFMFLFGIEAGCRHQHQQRFNKQGRSKRDEHADHAENEAKEETFLVVKRSEHLVRPLVEKQRPSEEIGQNHHHDWSHHGV